MFQYVIPIYIFSFFPPFKKISLPLIQFDSFLTILVRRKPRSQMPFCPWQNQLLRFLAFLEISRNFKNQLNLSKFMNSEMWIPSSKIIRIYFFKRSKRLEYTYLTGKRSYYPKRNFL